MALFAVCPNVLCDQVDDVAQNYEWATEKGDQWLAIKRDGEPLHLPDMLRRLARVLWFDDYNRFENHRTEIAALRNGLRMSSLFGR